MIENIPNNAKIPYTKLNKQMTWRVYDILCVKTINNNTNFGSGNDMW